MHTLTTTLLALALALATPASTKPLPQIPSDPGYTCVAEVLGAPPPSGSWVVQVVLRNEINMEVNSSGKDTLNVGDRVHFGGLGSNDIEYTYVSDNPAPELDMKYGQYEWKWSSCYEYTDQGVPYKRCTFPCLG